MPQLLVLAALVVTGSVLVGQPPAHAAAPRVTGRTLVSDVSTISSRSPKYAFAECPHPKKVVGGGALAVRDDPNSYRRLVLTRSAPYEFGSVSGFRAAAVEASPTDGGDLTRAQAHEQPQGYPYDWQLVASAICADTPAGYQVRYGESEEQASETTKHAVADCPEHTVLVGAGAAVSNMEPGNVALYSIVPNDLILSGDLASWASAQAAWTTSTPQPWDFMVAQAICVAK